MRRVIVDDLGDGGEGGAVLPQHEAAVSRLGELHVHEALTAPDTQSEGDEITLGIIIIIISNAIIDIIIIIIILKNQKGHVWLNLQEKLTPPSGHVQKNEQWKKMGAWENSGPLTEIRFYEVKNVMEESLILMDLNWTNYTM